MTTYCQQKQVSVQELKEPESFTEAIQSEKALLWNGFLLETRNGKWDKITHWKPNLDLAETTCWEEKYYKKMIVQGKN